MKCMQTNLSSGLEGQVASTNVDRTYSYSAINALAIVSGILIITASVAGCIFIGADLGLLSAILLGFTIISGLILIALGTYFCCQGNAFEAVVSQRVLVEQARSAELTTQLAVAQQELVDLRAQQLEDQEHRVPDREGLVSEEQATLLQARNQRIIDLESIIKLLRKEHAELLEEQDRKCYAEIIRQTSLRNQLQNNHQKEMESKEKSVRERMEFLQNEMSQQVTSHADELTTIRQTLLQNQEIFNQNIREQEQQILQIIKNWERFYFNPNYNLVIQPLIDRFVSSPEQVAHFCNSITFFEIEPLKKKLIDAFGVILSKKVKEVETTKAQQTLSILKSLDSNLWVSEKLIISPEALQDIISQDDADYTNLRKYLNLWETIQSYDIDKQQLVHYLMKGAKQLWNQGSCDDKALNLLRLILQFTNHDIESENIVFLFVKQVYRQMLTGHSITRLLKLEDFITEEGLTPITIREEEIANFLADAEFLYSQGEYHKCYLYSLWLTKIAPSPLAYRLLGLCLLENKCYLEAWGYLHSLPHNQRMHDSKVQKALIICQKHLPKDLGASYKRG